MKKKLEAELISIAHRILKLKSKSDVVLLHQETLRLYEKLSILRFVEEHFGEVKPTIGQAEIQEKLAEVFETNNQPEAEDLSVVKAELEIPTQEVAIQHKNRAPEAAVREEEAEIPSKITPETAVETVVEAEAVTLVETEIPSPEEIAEQKEEAPEEVTDVPAESNDEPIHTAESETFQPAAETKTEESKPELILTPTQFSFEDLLGNDYVDPIFVKPEELEKPRQSKEPSTTIPIAPIKEEPILIVPKSINDNDMKSVSLNDRLSKGIEIGLNDRIAFLKHLFANSSEDYNRVLSQLITFDTFGEARDFIDEMVKPDYNNWDGKEEYSIRFIEIIEKRFS